MIHIRSQVKTTQSQSYKFKKIAKTSNVEILQETLHATHLLKLLDKMYKYEMDPTRTVEATERTRDPGRTRDGQTEWNQYTPPTTSLCGGIIRSSKTEWIVGFYWHRNISQFWVQDTMYGKDPMGYVTWWSLLGLLSRYPTIVVKSLGAHRFYPWCIIFKWVAVTWLIGLGTRNALSRLVCLAQFVVYKDPYKSWVIARRNGQVMKYV